jgi:hypothetical protein
MSDAFPRATARDPVVGFADQALRYFRRDHEAIAREPLRTPAAWKGRDLAASEEWIVRLSDREVRELEAAACAARDAGAPLAALTRAHFPLPTLAERAREWVSELDVGRGFVVLRGLPVDRWGEELSAWAFWGLGQHLGEPGAQNPAGDLLGHVVDTGEDAGDPYVRRYRTAGAIAYHCDLADVVGLLCLRAAQSGGTSRIASSVSVYNALLERRPGWIDRLYEPFLLDARGEEGAAGPAWIPVPLCRHADGRLRTFFHSDYFRSVARHEGLARPTEEELEVLDLYEEIAGSQELRLDMQLEPGDVQWLSNHVVIHGRTAYREARDARDHGGPGRERHLLRLWLSLRPSGALEGNAT